MKSSLPEARSETTAVSTETILEARSLSRTLRSGNRDLHVLQEVSFAIPRGQFAVIIGPSGSGKSTLLALLAGLDRPTSGSVIIQGQAIESLPEDQLALLRRQKVGFVFQSFHLLSNFTAVENVMLPLELLGRSNARQRAMELLDRVGLADRGHHYPAQLSGGEQQRVALARAFAPEPAVLLADEPTGNLDGENGRVVMDMMRQLRHDQGSTLILVTHDMSLTTQADRVIGLRDGRVVEDRQVAAEVAR